MSDFSATRAIKKTRKPHRCEHCWKIIDPGSPAVKYSGVWQGDFSSVYMHDDCEKAGEAYAKMTDLWGEEWTWLHQLEEISDFQWLAEEYPAVAKRVGR